MEPDDDPRAAMTDLGAGQEGWGPHDALDLAVDGGVVNFRRHGDRLHLAVTGGVAHMNADEVERVGQALLAVARVMGKKRLIFAVTEDDYPHEFPRHLSFHESPEGAGAAADERNGRDANEAVVTEYELRPGPSTGGGEPLRTARPPTQAEMNAATSRPFPCRSCTARFATAEERHEHEDRQPHPCGALYDWEADGHPGGPQPPCTKPAGHQDGPPTDFKRAEHSDGHFKWPAEATAAPVSPDVDERVSVTAQAFEIVDGQRVPIGEPRETTLSRGALDMVYAEAEEGEREREAVRGLPVGPEYFADVPAERHLRNESGRFTGGPRGARSGPSTGGEEPPYLFVPPPHAFVALDGHPDACGMEPPGRAVCGRPPQDALHVGGPGQAADARGPRCPACGSTNLAVLQIGIGSPEMWSCQACGHDLEGDPLFEPPVAAELPLTDLRIDEFSDARPSPLRTYALRVTHLPTGIVVTSDSYQGAQRLRVRDRLLAELGDRLRGVV